MKLLLLSKYYIGSLLFCLVVVAAWLGFGQEMNVQSLAVGGCCYCCSSSNRSQRLWVRCFWKKKEWISTIWSKKISSWCFSYSLVIANFIFVIDSLVYGFYGVALFRVRLLVDVVGCCKYYLAMFRGNLIQFWCWTWK